MLSIRLAPLGDRAVMADFGEGLDEEVSARVLAVAARLRVMGVPGMRDVVPAVHALAVHVDPARLPLEQCARMIRSCAADEPGGTAPAGGGALVEVPVCYDEDLGMDLGVVAEWAGTTRDEVIAWHVGRTYRVFMLGFLPGFPYLGPVDPRIAAPRRSTPRARVEAGSVGIAGAQTGIYPRSSPGGWQIIGRTPMRVFDPAVVPPSAFAPGGAVRFVAIHRGRYESLRAEHAP